MCLPNIIVLDVDGIINPNPFARLIFSDYVSRKLAQLPILKKALLEVLEIGEVLLGAKYESKDIDITRLNRDVSYLGIITDRSLPGLMTALGEKSYILESMNFIQVRKSVFGNTSELRYGKKLWETNDVKPNESVLYRLADFAQQKRVKPHEVLIIDADPLFRFIAKSRFGFRAQLDDAINDE